MNANTQAFQQLTPDRVVASIEQLNLPQRELLTGFCLQLASYENRVYEIEFEPGGRELRAVAKFYRPGRWSFEQVQEEHQFLQDLEDAEVPAVNSIALGQVELDASVNASLVYALFPKVGGRQPEDLDRDQLLRLGRLIGRLHTVSRLRKSIHRPRLTPDSYGVERLKILLDSPLIHDDQKQSLESLALQGIEFSESAFQKQPLIRLHGDCHKGNILWNEQKGPFFIDFDDFVVGPPVQDLWLLSPNPDDLHVLIEGYQQIQVLPQRSLRLVEALRFLRMIHYQAWIVQRIEDPFFQRTFPQVYTPLHWDQFLVDLRQQLARCYDNISGETYGG